MPSYSPTFKTSVFLILAISCVIQTASSLSCYVCHSHNDQNCRDPNPNRSLIKDCNFKQVVEDENGTTLAENRNGIQMCITLIFQVGKYLLHKPNVTGYERETTYAMTNPAVVRLCGMGTKDEADRCITKNSRGGTRYKQCTCTTENCNDEALERGTSGWIYFITVICAIVVAGVVAFIVYRKTKCDFH